MKPREGALIPQHREFRFPLLTSQSEAIFSSCFDSGNCSDVRMISESEVSICKQSLLTIHFEQFHVETHPDFDAEKQVEGWAKSWFYFRVEGLRDRTTFNIHRLKMLFNLYQSGNSASYRPIVRVGEEGMPIRLDSAVSLEMLKDNVLRLSFMFDFSTVTPSTPVYFSFGLPYSFDRNLTFIESLHDRFSEDADVYFKREVLTVSSQSRPIHILTISSHDHKLNESESYISEPLFPDRSTNPRATKFKNKKPVVLVSARVHPGETPASFALEGFLEFLCDKKDLRGWLLRKYFTFWVVPMLNPDGVYAGHFRMDVMNQNLNRYYQVATLAKQPAVYAMKRVIQHLSADSRLFFYMDFHAHCGRKGTFLYGNALEDFALQVENQVFAKVMAINDPTFEYEFANFDKAQMRSKDRQNELSKEGCGRVFVHSVSKIVHSYTLECGFHHPATDYAGSHRSCLNKEFEVILATEQRQFLNEAVVVNSHQDIDNEKTKLVPLLERNEAKHESGSLELNQTGSRQHFENSASVIDADSPSQPLDIQLMRQSQTKERPLISPSGASFLNESSYKQTGKSVLLSLLDIYEKNPYSRLLPGEIDEIRKEVAREYAKAIRVKPIEETSPLQPAQMQPKKVKNIINILNETHFKKAEGMKVFQLHLRRGVQIDWPPSIKEAMYYKHTGRIPTGQLNNSCSPPTKKGSPLKRMLEQVNSTNFSSHKKSLIQLQASNSMHNTTNWALDSMTSSVIPSMNLNCDQQINEDIKKFILQSSEKKRKSYHTISSTIECLDFLHSSERQIERSAKKQAQAISVQTVCISPERSNWGGTAGIITGNPHRLSTRFVPRKEQETVSPFLGNFIAMSQRELVQIDHQQSQVDSNPEPIIVKSFPQRGLSKIKISSTSPSKRSITRLSKKMKFSTSLEDERASLNPIVLGRLSSLDGCSGSLFPSKFSDLPNSVMKLVQRLRDPERGIFDRTQMSVRELVPNDVSQRQTINHQVSQCNLKAKSLKKTFSRLDEIAIHSQQSQNTEGSSKPLTMTDSVQFNDDYSVFKSVPAVRNPRENSVHLYPILETSRKNVGVKTSSSVFSQTAVQGDKSCKSHARLNLSLDSRLGQSTTTYSRLPSVQNSFKTTQHEATEKTLSSSNDIYTEYNNTEGNYSVGEYQEGIFVNRSFLQQTDMKKFTNVHLVDNTREPSQNSKKLIAIVCQPHHPTLQDRKSSSIVEESIEKPIYSIEHEHCHSSYRSIKRSAALFKYRQRHKGSIDEQYTPDTYQQLSIHPSHLTSSHTPEIQQRKQEIQQSRQVRKKKPSFYSASQVIRGVISIVFVIR